jgi:DNA-binding SARP family transcriptional activator
VIEFRILGPLEAHRDGSAIPLGGPKQRALLAWLLLRANHPVSTDELVDSLWPDQDAESARQALRVAVSRLRASLNGDATLATRSAGYELQVAEEQVDLHRFRVLADEGERAFQAGEMEVAAARYAAALRLWRGPALAEIAVDGLDPESHRLEELRVTAIERRIEADLACGRHASLVAELDELVDRYPYREHLRRQQMLALYRSGRQAEALEAYRSARRRLVDELGIEPSMDLQELERAILRQAPELARPRSEPASTATPARERRRLALAGLGVVVLVAVAAASVAFVLVRHDSSQAAVETLSARTNSLVVLKEASGKPVANPTLGGAPSHLVVGAGAVWVLLPHAGVVMRVDPQGAGPKPIGVPTEAAGIAVGAGGVWLTDQWRAITRIDPSTASADPPIQLAPNRVFANAIADVTATDDAVWLASRDTAEAARYVVRSRGLENHLGAIDADASFFYGVGTAVIGHVPGEVWLTNRVDVTGASPGGHVVRLSDESGTVLSEFELGSPPLALAASGDVMWIASNNRVWRATRFERTPSHDLPVPGGPVALAADERGAWVATRDRQILQIDPAGTRIVRRWRLDKTPTAIGVGFGQVWVAVGSRD